MKYRYNVFVACDPTYHDAWAVGLARSIRHHNPWIRVVLLVINGRGRIQECPWAEYHYREADIAEEAAVIYYQCARFLYWEEIFGDGDLVLTLDADTVCTRAFTRSRFWRITKKPHVLWHDKQGQWLAGAVTMGRDQSFVQAIRQEILSVPQSEWIYGHDQFALRRAIQQQPVAALRNTGSWISIGKGRGIFLTLKGEQKHGSKLKSRFDKNVRLSMVVPPPPDQPLVRAVALTGPWLSGLPLPQLTTVQEHTIQHIDLDDLPDVWIIHNNTSNKRTIRYRKEYELVRDSGRPFVVIESPAFRHNQARPDDDNVYYRWSWFSYFRDQGIHYQPNSPGDRWLRIQQEQNIEILPWQPRGDNILFLLQRPGDSSMAPMIQRWGSYENMIQQTISYLRARTPRPIRLRLHPLRQGQQLEWLVPIMERYPDVKISQHSQSISDSWVSGGDSLYRDFDEAWAVVGGNSNGLTESACYGVPTWCLDSSAMAWPVSQRSLRHIESPDLAIDRQQWLNNLGYCQWRRDEILRGDPWFHLLQWWPQVQDLRKQMSEWPIITKT